MRRAFDIYGEPDRIRTPNLLIISQLLYQLRYRDILTPMPHLLMFIAIMWTFSCLQPTLAPVTCLQLVWLNVWLMTNIKCHIDRRSIERATKQQRELGQKVILVDPSGLRLAINAKSASWNYNYRKRGVDYYGKRHPQRTLRLGDTVSMTPQEARLRVEEVKAEVRNGGDPHLGRPCVKSQSKCSVWYLASIWPQTHSGCLTMIGQSIGLSSAEEYPLMKLHKIGSCGSGRCRVCS